MGSIRPDVGCKNSANIKKITKIKTNEKTESIGVIKGAIQAIIQSTKGLEQ
jgi:hypothetical protein